MPEDASGLSQAARDRLDPVVIDAPAAHAAVVTPHDSNDLASPARALLIGGTGGNIKINTVGGETVTIAVASYSYLLVRTARVWSTTTTATPIYALW